MAIQKIYEVSAQLPSISAAICLLGIVVALLCLVKMPFIRRTQEGPSLFIIPMLFTLFCWATSLILISIYGLISFIKWL